MKMKTKNVKDFKKDSDKVKLDNNLSSLKTLNIQLQDLDKLKKLNTNRLLNVYKRERGIFYRSFDTSYLSYVRDECEYLGKTYDDVYIEQLEDFNKFKKYLSDIKTILNTREHVK